jgi:hypothetical protein
MDRWQVPCALQLREDYGHDFRIAWLLAAYSRMALVASLRRPLPLIVLTGV